MRKIVFRPRAKADIIGIAEYTKAQHGEAQAKRYIEDLQRQIEFAVEFPGIGSEAMGLHPIYRKLRAGLHRVIYRHTDGELIIVRILHKREDAPDQIEDF